MNYHRAKFDGHGHSGSGVVMILICHVISQDHVIKVTYDLTGSSII